MGTSGWIDSFLKELSYENKTKVCVHQPLIPIIKNIGINTLPKKRKIISDLIQNISGRGNLPRWYQTGDRTRSDIGRARGSHARVVRIFPARTRSGIVSAAPGARFRQSWYMAQPDLDGRKIVIKK